MKPLLLAQLAQQIEAWGILIAVLAIVAGAIVFALRLLKGGRADEQWARLLKRAEQRAGASRQSPAAGPIVQFQFHTYSGFLVFFTQTQHQPELPAKVALAYLRELHRYNLVNLLIPYPGLVFVPFLTFANYASERKKIVKAMNDWDVGARN